MKASSRALTLITGIAISWPLLLAVAIFGLGPRNGPTTYFVMAIASFAVAIALIVWKTRTTRIRRS